MLIESLKGESPSDLPVQASFNVCSRSPPPISASSGLIVTEAYLSQPVSSARGSDQQTQTVQAPRDRAALRVVGVEVRLCIHGFSLRGRQQTKARRPLGFNDARMLANAATGSQNITPKRECPSEAPKGPPLAYAAMPEVVFTLCVHWSSDPTICARSRL